MMYQPAMMHQLVANGFIQGALAMLFCRSLLSTLRGIFEIVYCAYV